jgi:formyl-CoA transferase
MTSPVTPLGAERSGPLIHYKVLDLGVLFAAPLIGSYLADFGADVVKVERPDGGDSLRHLGVIEGCDSLPWKYTGRNKRSIAADLRTSDGQDMVRRLVAKADVVLENFRPGVMERWNLGWDDLHEINPRLVMARVSGFGQQGPYRNRPGFGTIAESMSGYASINGWPDGPPTLPPFGLADGVAALAGAFSVVSALLWRDRVSGEGQSIDIAITDPIFALLGAQATVYDKTGVVQARTGNRVAGSVPRGAYRCRDGKWVALSGSTQAIAERIFAAIGRTDLVEDPRFATNRERIKHADEVDDLLVEWISARDRAEVLEVLVASEAAVGPIYTIADILEDEHFKERPMFVRVPDAELGDVLVPNVIAHLSDTPAAMRHAGRPLDADRDSILADWLLTTASND